MSVTLPWLSSAVALSDVSFRPRSWNWISCGDIHISPVRNIKVLLEEFRAPGNDERGRRANSGLLWRAEMKSYWHIYVWEVLSSAHMTIFTSYHLSSWSTLVFIVFCFYSLHFDPFCPPSVFTKKQPRCFKDKYIWQCCTSALYRLQKVLKINCNYSCY